MPHKDPKQRRLYSKKYQKVYQARPEYMAKRRDYWLRKKYGLSLKQYEKMLRKQHGVCAICKGVDVSTRRNGVKGRALAVDHNHNCCPSNKACSKCIRGLLCRSCNIAISKFKDSQRMLRAASLYLKRYRVKNVVR